MIMFRRFRRYQKKPIYVMLPNPDFELGVDDMDDATLYIPIDVKTTIKYRNRVYSLPIHYSNVDGFFIVSSRNVRSDKKFAQYEVEFRKKQLKEKGRGEKYYSKIVKYNDDIYLMYETILQYGEAFCEKCGNITDKDFFEISQEHLSENLCTHCFSAEMREEEDDMVEEYYKKGEVSKRVRDDYFENGLPFCDVKTKSGRNLEYILY